MKKIIFLALFILLSGCKKEQSFPFTGEWLITVTNGTGTVSDEVLLSIVQISDKITGTYDYVNTNNETEEIVESQVSGQRISFAIDIANLAPESKFYYEGNANTNYDFISGTWERMNISCSGCNGNWSGYKVK